MLPFAVYLEGNMISKVKLFPHVTRILRLAKYDIEKEKRKSLFIRWQVTMGDDQRWCCGGGRMQAWLFGLKCFEAYHTYLCQTV